MRFIVKALCWDQAMTVNVEVTAVSGVQADVSDRRRVGRKPVSPELIPLLRAPGKGDEVPDDLRRLLEDEGELPIEADPIASARGIALGVALSVPIWGVIGGVVYALLK